MNYKNCNECPAMKRSPDPDPNDSFNYDDEKRHCAHANNKELDRYCRPYEKTSVPDWCPIKS